MKRFLDVFFALLALLPVGLILLLVAPFSVYFIGRPIFFFQSRPGLNGKKFRMAKLRTMSDKRDENGDPLPDEQRMTRFGNFLRKASLDELPEIWNILKGDMSWIGPRPLLEEYLPLYSERQAKRHNVRPGLTGWAQVNGRNLASWDDRLEMDAWYVDHQTLALDLKIVWMTIHTVLGRKGVSADGKATMDKFTGK